jgi:hypothetical protein
LPQRLLERIDGCLHGGPHTKRKVNNWGQIPIKSPINSIPAAPPDG